MLGRHVYRVTAGAGGWTVRKEGEIEDRGSFAQREQALAEACRLAADEPPSRVTVADGDGVLLEERLFGSDLGQELDVPG